MFTSSVMRGAARLMPRVVPSSGVTRLYSSSPTHVPIVLTAIGPDKVGLMSKITGVVSSHQGNVEAGEMKRLGGDFSVMMLVQVPDAKLAPLNESLKKIEGLTVVTHKTNVTQNVEKSRQRIVKLNGADSIGILNKICEYFEKNNINIDDMSTASDLAPFSGTPIFCMEARVSVPTQITATKFEAGILSYMFAAEKT